jgi:hypothetical protein
MIEAAVNTPLVGFLKQKHQDPTPVYQIVEPLDVA